jgi:hypothetical protein
MGGLVRVLNMMGTLYAPLTRQTVDMVEQLNESCRLCSPVQARTQTT